MLRVDNFPSSTREYASRNGAFGIVEGFTTPSQNRAQQLVSARAISACGQLDLPWSCKRLHVGTAPSAFLVNHVSTFGVGVPLRTLNTTGHLARPVVEAMAQSNRGFIDDGMSPPAQKTPPLKFWDDCADPADIQALWAHPAVKNEWITAGENPGQKVHMSRAFEGEPEITEVEMRAIAEIVLGRYFTKLDTTMICAIAEIESSRYPLAYRWEESVQEASTGLMQVLQSTADWLARDMGYKAYTIDWTSSMLYRPFVSVYFGAAYLKWLSTYDGKKRSEEFMVRGYNGGPKGASSKSTSAYWTKYLIAKQNLQMKSNIVAPPGATLKPKSRVKQTAAPSSTSKVVHPQEEKYGSSKKKEWTYWEEKCSVEDLETLWNHADVKKEWVKAGEKRGKVRFSRDTRLRPFLTVTELKAIADNVAARFFSHNEMSPVMLCAIAEISSNRLIHGLNGQSGIMGLSFATAMWLYQDMGYKSYRLKVKEDLSKPFVAMYFGAAYVCWLSNHGNRPRSDEFVVRGYKGGVDAVDDPGSRAFWQRFLEAKEWTGKLLHTIGQSKDNFIWSSRKLTIIIEIRPTYYKYVLYLSTIFDKQRRLRI